MATTTKEKVLEFLNILWQEDKSLNWEQDENGQIVVWAAGEDWWRVI